MAYSSRDDHAVGFVIKNEKQERMMSQEIFGMSMTSTSCKSQCERRRGVRATSKSHLQLFNANLEMHGETGHLLQ